MGLNIKIQLIIYHFLNNLISGLNYFKNILALFIFCILLNFIDDRVVLLNFVTTIITLIFVTRVIVDVLKFVANTPTLIIDNFKVSIKLFMYLLTACVAQGLVNSKSVDNYFTGVTVIIFISSAIISWILDNVIKPKWSMALFNELFDINKFNNDTKMSTNLLKDKYSSEFNLISRSLTIREHNTFNSNVSYAKRIYHVNYLIDTGFIDAGLIAVPFEYTYYEPGITGISNANLYAVKRSPTKDNIKLS